MFQALYLSPGVVSSCPYRFPSIQRARSDSGLSATYEYHCILFQEEKTYTELGTQQAPDSIHHSHTQRFMTGYNSSATAGTNHLTPSRSGTTSAFLTLSSVLRQYDATSVLQKLSSPYITALSYFYCSPSVQNMSPRVSGLGYSSLRANNYTASPSTTGNRLNPSLR